MSGQTHDPTPGTPQPDPSPSGPLGPAGPEAIEGGTGQSAPLAPSSSSSGDELNAILTEAIIQPHPDPFLGEFSADRPDVDPTPDTDQGRPGSPEASAASSAPSVPDSKTHELRSDPDEPSDPVAPVDAGTAGSFDALAALATLTGLDSTASPTADRSPTFQAPLVTRPAKTGPPNDGAIEAEDEDEGEEELPSRRSSWLTLLLVSYASAVTLGLLWVLSSERAKLREGDEIDLFPAGANRPDPGRRADQSRKVVPLPPLNADHLAGLGQSVRLGSLEATPLEITLGRVDLEGAFDESDRRVGGTDALRLKLRLENVSSDTIFVPLDEAFIRERVVGKPDSFIETANGGQIAMYPLAVASEWSIRGQTFKELQPGEAFDAKLVSAPLVTARLSPQMTWRIRLRTGIEQTDTLGVRFRRDEIR